MKKFLLMLVSCFCLLFVGSCKCEKNDGKQDCDTSNLTPDCAETKKKELDTLPKKGSKDKPNENKDKGKILKDICIVALEKLKRGEYEDAYLYSTASDIEGIENTDLDGDACLQYVKGTVFLQKGKNESGKQGICEDKKTCLELATEAYKNSIDFYTKLKTYNDFDFGYKVYNNYSLLKYESSDVISAGTLLLNFLNSNNFKKAAGFICHNAALIGLHEELRGTGCESYVAQAKKESKLIEGNKNFYLYQLIGSADEQEKIIKSIKLMSLEKADYLVVANGQSAVVSNLKTRKVERIVVGDNSYPKDESNARLKPERSISLNSFYCHKNKENDCKKIESEFLGSLLSSEKYKLLDSQDKLSYYFKHFRESQLGKPSLSKPLYFDIFNKDFTEEIKPAFAGITHLMDARCIDNKISFELIDVVNGHVTIMVPPKDITTDFKNQLDNTPDRIPDKYTLGIYAADTDAKKMLAPIQKTIQEKLKEFVVTYLKVIKNILTVHVICQAGFHDEKCISLEDVRNLNGIIFVTRFNSFIHMRVASVETGMISFSQTEDNSSDRTIDNIASNLAEKIKKENTTRKNKIKFDYEGKEFENFATSLLGSKILNSFSNIGILESQFEKELESERTIFEKIFGAPKQFFRYFTPTHCLKLTLNNNKLLELRVKKSCKDSEPPLWSDTKVHDLNNWGQLDKALNELITKMKKYPMFSEKVTVTIEKCTVDGNSVTGVKVVNEISDSDIVPGKRGKRNFLNSFA